MNDLRQTLELSCHLVSLCLLIQGLEIFFLFRRTSAQSVWSYKNVGADLESALPLPRLFVRALMSNQSLSAIAAIQMTFAALSFIWIHPVLFGLLFLTHLLICLRFRGTFNGGSDMMTFVVLTGLLICLLASKEKYQKLGFVYIAIHTLYSYFKAGFVKIREPDWRQGRALPEFLNRSLYPDIRQWGLRLKQKRLLSLTLCWLTIIFEMGSLVLVFTPQFSFQYFLIAMGFHFVVFISFGLNRFFWSWMSAWPATLFVLALLAQH